MREVEETVDGWLDLQFVSQSVSRPVALDEVEEEVHCVLLNSFSPTLETFPLPPLQTMTRVLLDVIKTT